MIIWMITNWITSGYGKLKMMNSYQENDDDKLKMLNLNQEEYWWICSICLGEMCIYGWKRWRNLDEIHMKRKIGWGELRFSTYIKNMVYWIHFSRQVIKQQINNFSTCFYATFLWTREFICMIYVFKYALW